MTRLSAKRATLARALASVAVLSSAAGSVCHGQVETVRLDDGPFALGTLTPGEGALPPDLWRGASPDTLRVLFAALPGGYDEPALTALAGRVLLSPGAAPTGADDGLAGAKLLAASRAGFYREAAELAGLAPMLRDEPALAEVVATAALLEGDVTAACRQGAGLARGRREAFWLKLRLVCYAANDEGSAADLTLGLLRDQGVLTPGDERVFDALIAGGSLGASVSPEGPFQYAAADMLGAEVSVDALPELPGSVLAAVARDADAPDEVRDEALIRAVGHGLIGRQEALSLLRSDAGSPIVAGVVSVLSTPEGTPERTASVVAALREAKAWPAFEALAVLLADDVTAARLTPGLPLGAPELALAAAAAGQVDAARRFAALAADEADAGPFAPALLGLLDASAVDPELLGAGARGEAELASLVAASLDVAADGSAGAAGLAALGLMGIAAEGEADAVRRVVAGDMLARSGLAASVALGLALSIEGPRLFSQMSEAPATDGSPAPRLKPDF